MTIYQKPRKTVRIYYNEPGKSPLWWDVPVSRAKQDVTVDASMIDVINGFSGTTIGCRLSNAAMRDKTPFPHDVLIVSVTPTTMYAVDQIKNGSPSHCWWYKHNYGKWVDLNDADIDKTYFTEHPERAEQKLRFTVPPKRQHDDRGGKPHPVPLGKKRSYIPHGQLGRAVKAGLISKPIAKVLSS